MSRIFKKTAEVIITAVFVLNVSGCATYRVHPEFKERHKNIKSVSLMPPRVEAYILNFQGDKKMLTELIPVMEKTTVEQLERILTDKGYAINKIDLSEENLVKNPELRTSLFHINEIFEKQLQDISKRKKSKFTYTVGADANTFANLGNCDILIFVKEDGIKKSAGEIAKDVAKGAMLSAAALLIGVVYIPIPRTAVTIVHIAVVDGNDGAILWYNNNVATPDCDPENQKQITSLIKSIISQFPDSVLKKKEGKKTAEQVQPKDIASKGTNIVPTATQPSIP